MKTLNVVLLCLIEWLLHNLSITFAYCKISNLNIFLRDFDRCLVHLINFQAIDYLPLTVPILTTSNRRFKYLINRRWTGQKIPKKQDLTPKIKNWFCTFQAFIYPTFETDPDWMKHSEIPFAYLKFGRQVYFEEEQYYYEKKPFEVYHVLIIESKNWNHKTSPWWHNHLIIWVGYSARLHLHYDCLVFKTRNVTNHANKNISDFHSATEIINLEFLIPMQKNPFTFVYDSRNVNLLAKLRQIGMHLKNSERRTNGKPWRIYLPERTDFWPSRGTFAAFGSHKLHFPRSQMYKADKVGLLYRMQALLGILLQNNSYFIFDFVNLQIDTYRCQDRSTFDFVSCYGPVITTEKVSRQNYMLNLVTATFTFMSCTKKKKSILSFELLHQAFNGKVWLSILFTYFFILCMIRKILMTKRTSTLFDVIFIGYSILLEQGTKRFGESRRSKLIFGLLVILGLILSNAYKGENINLLTLPIRPDPLDTFESILDNDLSLLDLEYPIPFSDIRNWRNPSWSTFTDKMVSKIRFRLKKVRREHAWPTVMKCDGKSAVFLRSFTSFGTKLDLLKKNTDVTFEDLAVGKDYFEYSTDGMMVHNNLDERIPLRADILLQSGIHQKWEEMWYRFTQFTTYGTSFIHLAPQRDRRLLKERYKRERKKSGMALKGNIATVFLMLSIGYLFCGGIFAFEMGKIIANSVRRLLTTIPLLYHEAVVVSDANWKYIRERSNKITMETK